jgi:sugar lactone lactonase YvrE
VSYWVADYWANDLAWDAHGAKLYLAVSVDSTKAPNNIVALDPVSRTQTAAIALPASPNLLATSDDGQYLYVWIPDAHIIRRLRLPSLQTDLDIAVAPNPAVTQQVTQLMVAPGKARTLAVSGNYLSTPGWRGELRIYDDATMRPREVEQFISAPGLFFSPEVGGFTWNPAADTIYAGGLLKMAVDTDGVRFAERRSAALFGKPWFYDGMLYSDGGMVFDTRTNVARGKFADCCNVVQRAIIPRNGKAFAVSSGSGDSWLNSFSLGDLAIVDSLRLVGDEWVPAHLVPWGEEGLAMARENKGVAIMSGSFFRTETISRSQQPFVAHSGTVTYENASADYTVLRAGANKVVSDACANRLYVAISGYSTDLPPNSVIAIDPLTGSQTKVTPLPGEPDTLALSDDCSLLYVGFYYNNTVQRLKAPSLAPDIVAPIPAAFDDAAFARKISVAPGNAHSWLLTKGTMDDGLFCRAVDYGIGVFDDATERANTYYTEPYTSQSVVFGQDASIAYGSAAELGAPASYTIGLSGVTNVAKLPGDVINELDYYNPVANRLYDFNLDVFDLTTGTSMPRFSTDWHPAQLVNQCAVNTVVTSRRLTGNVIFAYQRPDPQGRYDENGFPLNGVGLDVFDWRTQNLLSRLYLGYQMGYPRAVAAWGDDGVAVTTSGGYLILMHGPALAH